MAAKSDHEVVATKELFKYPPEFPEIDGIIYLPLTTRKLLSSIANLPVKDGDVFVATYPKAGTTWVSEILWQIYNGGQIDKKQIMDRVPFIEIGPSMKEKWGTLDRTPADFYNDKLPPRLYTTHLQYYLVPKGEGSAPKAKYIYIIRNPKDCAVSLYHMHQLQRMAFCQFRKTWDDFFEIFIRGKVVFGSWFDHVLGWWAHRDDPNILFLKYEDMKKDLEDAVRKIAQFVGKDLTQEMIQRITNQTTFDAMKDGKQFYQQDSPTHVAGETKFMRKGEVGDWRNYFTEEQNQRFDKMYKERMAGSELQVEF